MHLKKQEVPSYVESYDSSFNPSKTFGGERSKNIVMGIRQVDNNEVKR